MSVLEVSLKGTVGTLPIDVAFRAEATPLVLVGPNGAGKTQTLMMILGATRPSRGHVTLDGTPLFAAERGLDLPVEQRRIGFLPQRYALFPHLDVLSNVGYGIAAPDRGERLRLAREMLRDPYWPLRAARELNQSIRWPEQYARAAPAVAK